MDMDPKKPASNLAQLAEKITFGELIKSYKKFLNDEDSRLEKLCDNEFATEEDHKYRENFSNCFSRDGMPSISYSKTLLKHPNLAQLIEKILGEHGDTQAQSRRRDQRAHTVGVRKISKFYGENIK